MAKVQQRHGAVQHNTGAGKAGQGSKPTAGQDYIEGQPAPQENQVPVAARTSQADRLEAKQREAEQDLAAIRGAQQQKQSGQQVAGHPTPVSQEALQSLMNARKMMQRASAPRTYTSRLPSPQVWSQIQQPCLLQHWCQLLALCSSSGSLSVIVVVCALHQVVIKLQDTHPEQLVSDVVKSTANVLRSSG
jgi:hypothetical protein